MADDISAGESESLYTRKQIDEYAQAMGITIPWAQLKARKFGPQHVTGKKCEGAKCDYCDGPSYFAYPTSLEGLQESRLAQQQASAIQSLAYDFQDVTAGIMQSDDIPDKAQAIAQEVSVFQQMLNDLSSGLKSLVAKWGARHSKTDNDAIQTVHDMALQLGALCTGKAKSAFGVCKGRDGQYYGLGVFTNCYQDLDGEIITDAAHKEFAHYLDANPSQAPELWTWHEPGTARKSRANLWDYDGTLFWMQWPLTEQEAKALQNVGPLTMSHQFNGLKANNEWGFYRSFEASVLSPSAEANPLTSFETVAKESLMFTPEKRALFVALHGEEFTREKELASDKARKDADVAGLARKEAEKAKAETIPTAPFVTPDDAFIILTESVKAFSVQLQSLDARVSALTQAKTKEVTAQVEAATDARMSWLTSPRAPTSGIAEQAKARGGQITPEQLAAMGVQHDDPATAWTKEIKRTTR